MSPRPSRPRRRAVVPAPAGIPAEFRARMERLLGEQAGSLLAAMERPPVGLRVNTLRLPARRFEAMAAFALEPLPFPPGGYRVADEDRPGAHPHHAAGLYYLQDPGAMVVGALPPLPRGARVLDLAAAPGGKTTHLAARMLGDGVLVANDVHAGRARELAGNLERCGVRNAVVTSDAPERLADRWGDGFDVVLVDAPCSGESMFHKSEAARREWSPESVAGCARRQGEILTDAARLVRPGGLLLYSTCTFSPEENEGVLARFLAGAAGAEFEVEDLPQVPGAEAGRPEWAGGDADGRIARALRLWPHRVPGAGHFVAALRRTPAAGAPPVAAPPGAHGGRPSSEGVRALEEFLAARVPGLTLPAGDLVAWQDEIYLRPDGAPPLGGVRVLRHGWWLGTVRKGRFEPSHSLALGIRAADAEERVDLSGDGTDVDAYLRGETLEVPGGDGWVLVTVDGFPLGWGKRTRGVVKNHYPRGLRRR